MAAFPACTTAYAALLILFLLLPDAFLSASNVDPRIEFFILDIQIYS